MPHSRLASTVGALVGLLVGGVVAGVLVTALVAPAVAAVGVGVSSSADLFENLPDYIKPDVLAQKTNIFATQSDGSPILLASVFDQDRQEVGWDQISENVKDAAVATEDPRFYSHNGVDIAATLRAAVGNALDTSASGASTITMQYVRNILIQRAEAVQDPTQSAAAYKEATATTLDRKLEEMRLAIGLEKEYSKDDILLGYLNIAPFGGRVYGIQSAAQYYFGVDASALTLPQAASLVAIVNEPNGLRIDVPDDIAANKARRDEDVLASMLKEHAITKAQYDEAVATPVTPVITPPSTGCQTANPIAAGFFCDYVTRIVKNDPTFGADEASRWEKFKTGGYQIYTTLDVDLQKAAMATMNSYVPKSTDFDLGSALDTVEPGTGRVLAMVQNKDFSDDPEVTATNLGASSVNYSTDYDYGGSTGFQVGSTYKAFTLAEWLETGHSLSDVVNGNPGTLDVSTFADSCDGAGTGPYAVVNDGGEAPGNVTVLQATADSVNLAYLRMAQKLDQCAIRKTAESFGVHRADGDPLVETPSAVLGTNEIAPLTMAAAYAGIANNGVYCSPIAIDRILDASGNPVAVPQSNCSEAVTPQIADTMIYALQGVISDGTATNADPHDGVAHFGKTGTTDSEKDTWFVGSSDHLTTAVWVGNVTGSTSIRNSTISGISGGDVRNLIWRDYMADADGKYGGSAFPAPTAALVNGKVKSAPVSPSPTPTATPAPTPTPSASPTPAPGPAKAG